MPAITQVIRTLPPPPNPAVDDNTTYPQKASAFTSDLVLFGGELNEFARQANSLAVGSIYGLQYTYLNATTSSDPGVGKLKFNNATLANVTALYLNEKDVNNVAQDKTIAAWCSAPQALKGVLRVIKASDATKFVEYRVTGAVVDNGTWDTLNLTYQNGNGTFANNDAVVLCFERFGADGLSADFVIPTRSITANGSITSADNGYFLEAVGGTWTATFDTPAALGAGFNCTLQDSQQTVTFAGTFSDGATSKTFPPGSVVQFVGNGVNIRVVVIASPGASSVRGLVGAFNTNTTYNLSADAVTLRNARGQAVTIIPPAQFTCNLGLAGPVANGRDQAAAFPANSWLYLYFISTGGNVATLASLTPPSAFNGSTLPAGYTYWAFATALRWNASSNLIPSRTLGRTVWYQLDNNTGTPSRVLAAQNNGPTFNPLSLAALVPPNALMVDLLGIMSGSHNAVANFTLRVRPTGSGLATGVILCTLMPQVPSTLAEASGRATIPLGSASQIDYMVLVASATMLAYIDVVGYTIPNGGE